jgi:hypothetical protein
MRRADHATAAAQTSNSDRQGHTIMTARSARNVETQKKKARRKADRPKLSRPTGNSPAVRRQLKKLANLRNGRPTVEAATAE